MPRRVTTITRLLSSQCSVHDWRSLLLRCSENSKNALRGYFAGKDEGSRSGPFANTRTSMGGNV
jgi:hypothetical protein